MKSCRKITYELYRNPRNRYLSILYFMLGLQFSFYDYSMKMDLIEFGFSISDISYLSIIISLVWFFKSVPALFSDTFGVNGFHRKPYIIISNLLAALATLMVSQKFEKASGYIIGIFFYHTLICFSNVNLEACAVEDTKKESREKRGNFQSQLWAAKELGITVGEITGPLAWSNCGSSAVYFILSGFCLLNFLLGIKLPDSRKNMFQVNEQVQRSQYYLDQLSFKNILNAIYETVSHPILSRLILFNYIIFLFPGSGLTMFYYLTGPMHFSPTDMAILGFISSLGKCLGIGVYLLIKNQDIYDIYIFSIFFSFCLSLLPIFIALRLPVQNINYYFGPSGFANLNITNTTITNETFPLSDIYGWNNFAFVFTDDTLGGILKSVKHMPLITITSILCRSSMEATITALVSGGFNIMHALHNTINASVLKALGINHHNFSNLYIFILLCSTFEMVTLFLSFSFIPSVKINEIQCVQDEFFIENDIVEDEGIEEIELKNKNTFYTNKETTDTN